MKITKSLLKALKIIANFEHPGLYHEIWASKFAELMWPDSLCWRRVYKVGHGSTRGKGMWLCAGSYLNKLRYAGVVYRRFLSHGQAVYGITRAGLKRLKESQEESK